MRSCVLPSEPSLALVTTIRAHSAVTLENGSI
jgi:hypothetical protein